VLTALNKKRPLMHGDAVCNTNFQTKEEQKDKKLFKKINLPKNWTETSSS